MGSHPLRRDTDLPTPLPQASLFSVKVFLWWLLGLALVKQIRRCVKLFHVLNFVLNPLFPVALSLIPALEDKIVLPNDQTWLSGSKLAWGLLASPSFFPSSLSPGFRRLLRRLAKARNNELNDQMLKYHFFCLCEAEWVLTSTNICHLRVVYCFIVLLIRNRVVVEVVVIGL